MTLSVLVTGGAGYIGSTLVPKLLQAGNRVRVLDRFYFGEEGLREAKSRHGEHLTLTKGDVRRLDAAAFRGVDAVVDLAGISNDPSCELKPELTREINLQGALETMRLAKANGVKRYVFASSCSVYGRGEGLGLSETSPLHPVSLYAKCKAEAEAGLLNLRGNGMCLTILRLATVFGYSRRMRFDLAVNVMTKNAYTRGSITVEGGGRQWRPFVHVADVADTMMFMLQAPAESIDREVFNVGHAENNVRILNLAYRVRDQVPGTQIVMAPTDPDLRNYNVQFEKLQDVLAESPFRTIDQGILEVLDALRNGKVDPLDRRWYTLDQYRFLADVERTFREVALDGRVLS